MKLNNTSPVSREDYRLSVQAEPACKGITVEEYLGTQYLAFRRERRRAENQAQYAALHTESLADFLAQYRSAAAHTPLPVIEAAPKKRPGPAGEGRLERVPEFPLFDSGGGPGHKGAEGGRGKARETKGTVMSALRTAIEWLHADATHGLCALCEARLPPPKTKPRIICADPGCLTAYNRLYRVDRSAREGRKPRALTERP